MGSERAFASRCPNGGNGPEADSVATGGFRTFAAGANSLRVIAEAAIRKRVRIFFSATAQQWLDFHGNRLSLLAAERTGRIARLIELDPLYCDVICRRYEAITGQPARLDGTDQAFGDVAIDRAAETAPQSVEAAE